MDQSSSDVACVLLAPSCKPCANGTTDATAAHIKESYEERGVSDDEAEERAARTVTKQRREKGETKHSNTN